MPFGFRRALQVALLLPVIVWMAVSFYVEIDKTWRRSRRVLEPQTRPPNLWEIESTDMQRLAEALAWADEQVPPGRPLAFTSAPGKQMAARRRYSWAMYLLPSRDVIPFPDRIEAVRGEYLLAYRVSPERPDLAGTPKKEVAERDGSVLYRLSSEGPQEAPGEGTQGAAKPRAPGADDEP